MQHYKLVPLVLLKIETRKCFTFSTNLFCISDLFSPYSVTCFKLFGRIYSSFAHEHALLLRGLISSVSTEHNYTFTLSCVSTNCIGGKPCLLVPKSEQSLVPLRHKEKESARPVEQVNMCQKCHLTCLSNPISFSTRSCRN